MKTSFFNPEVHSLTFDNFEHKVCGVSWGAQCGGMCTVTLRRFYDGVLIDCESARSGFEDEIWDCQFLIVSKDIYKSCDWDTSVSTLNTISDRIDAGKPTLLYLDQEDYNLTSDHFVIAYAIHDESENIKKIYIYDPNCIYKRHYCNDPNKSYRQSNNFTTWLELDYSNKRVTRKSAGNQVILGFTAYNHIHDFTHEKEINHSCDITRLSVNSSEFIGSKPAISHKIKVSKTGNVPADLKLLWRGDQILYQNGDNLYTQDLISSVPNCQKHLGLQFSSGGFEKTWNLYEAYNQANWTEGTLTVQSNFVEKKLFSLRFPKPEILTFTVSANTPSSERSERGYINAEGIGNVFVINGLKQSDVIECEKLPENYGKLPANRVSFYPDDYSSAINAGTYDMFKHLFYLGYVKSNIVIELVHNGLYQGANVRMTTNNPPTTENHQFVNQAVVVTLSGGDQSRYDSNAVNYCNFDITGKGINSGFSDRLSGNLQYRCLIIHEPMIHNPSIVATDVFARYFEKILINIPNTPLGAQWNTKFENEIARNPGVDRKKYIEQFRKKFTEVLVNELKSMSDSRMLREDITGIFSSFENFRKERTGLIIAKSKNLGALDRKLNELEDLIRVQVGNKLITKKSVVAVIKKVLQRRW